MLTVRPPEKTVTFAALRALLAPIFTKFRLRVLAGVAALIAVDILQLRIPHFIRQAIDALAQGTATPQLLRHLALSVIGLALCIALCRFAWRSLLIGFSRLLERELRERLVARLLTLDQPFFERRTAGDLMAHASNDLSVIQMAFGMGVVAAVDILVLSAAALAFMLVIDVRLTLLALLPMPILSLVMKKLGVLLQQRVNAVQEQFAKITEFVRATLGAVRLIKACTLENMQTRRLEGLGLTYVQNNMKAARVQGLMAPFSGVCGSAGMMLLLLFGGKMVIEGQVSIGAFVAFMAYLNMLIWPMIAIGWVANVAQRGLTSLRRVYTLLQEQPEVDTAGLTKVRLAGVHKPAAYSCRGLSFRYAGGESPALINLDFEFGPGLTGLTGRTGSGKSTLCALFLRLYPLPPGMLFFQGTEVNALSQADIRAHLAWAGQEPFLFADTIGENITLGKPDASWEEIAWAARMAAIDEEISAFPGGYEALAGERGIRLSGGQKQRIALARAFLLKRPMLILDDALSAVDVATEREILNNIREHFSQSATLIVSQRANVLEACDRVAIMADGRINALAAPAALHAQPFYRLLLDKQKTYGRGLR